MHSEFEKNSSTLVFSFDERMDTLGSNRADLEIEKKITELGGKHEDVFTTIIQNNKEKFERIKLVFDLKNVGFVSSSFMRICLKYAKKVQSENFEIINTSLIIKKTFKIAGLDKAIKIL